MLKLTCKNLFKLEEAVLFLNEIDAEYIIHYDNLSISILDDIDEDEIYEVTQLGLLEDSDEDEI